MPFFTNQFYPGLILLVLILSLILTILFAWRKHRELVFVQRLFRYLGHEIASPLYTNHSSLNLLLAKMKNGSSFSITEKTVADLKAPVDVSLEFLSALKAILAPKGIGAAEPPIVVDLSDIINSVSDSYVDTLHISGITMNRDLDTTVQTSIPADILRVIVRNLIRSAIHIAMVSEESSKQIHIRLYRKSSTKPTVLVLTATGTIPSHLRNIFCSRFRNSGSDDSHEFGLALTLHLLKQHGMRVELDNCASSHTTMKINIPER